MLVCVCVCGGAGGVTRSFPLAIARERGECPLQRRSVLALWDSRRATTLLAFCTETMMWREHLLAIEEMPCEVFILNLISSNTPLERLSP